MSEATQPARRAELGGFLLGLREGPGCAHVPTPSEWRPRCNRDLEGMVTSPWGAFRIPWLPQHIIGPWVGSSQHPAGQRFQPHFTSDKRRDLPKVTQCINLDPGPRELYRPALPRPGRALLCLLSDPWPSSRPSPAFLSGR